MTQLQPTAGHSTGAPVSQGAHWNWQTIGIVFGAFVLMAAAFGIAMWLDSDSETTTRSDVQTVTVEPSSVEIVQAEIDSAIAVANAEPSSVEIVQAEVDSAVAAATVAPSSVEIVQAEIDAALTAQARQWTPYWVTQAGIDAASFDG